MHDQNFTRISVIGLGYIGLPTAAMFASRRIQVVGVDVNQATVDIINRGEVHIVEPGLAAVVYAAITEGYLRATTVAEPADAFLLAVPTPFKGNNHDPDLEYVKSAVHAVAPVLEAGNIVILESTSPVGATEAMANWLAEARPDLSFPQTAGDAADIHVAHCPERVLPGNVLEELVTNDRIIGGMSRKSSELALRLYRTFVSGDCVIASGPRAAELSKLSENAFRDVNIAFANELSMVCDHLGIDVWELINLANRHPRVNILQPGPGVGGHCIAVDPWFIISSDPDRANLIRMARQVNDFKPQWVIDKVRALTAAAGSEKVTIACLGLAFKPDIDDLRESPALAICKELSSLPGVDIVAVEPHIKKLPTILEDTGVLLVGAEDAIERADIVLALVAHSAFRDLDIDTLEGKAVFDVSAVWERARWG